MIARSGAESREPRAAAAPSPIVATRVAAITPATIHLLRFTIPSLKTLGRGIGSRGSRPERTIDHPPLSSAGRFPQSGGPFLVTSSSDGFRLGVDLALGNLMASSRRSEGSRRRLTMRSGSVDSAPTMHDWATISALATAGGTLVLAIATFASV